VADDRIATAPRTHVRITTDGACKGNPGPGGWAAILECNGQEKQLSGAEPLTTNNRMEMTAALKGLEALTRPADVTLVTDSRYLLDGLTRWLPGWKRNGWKTAAKQPVKNDDLWRALDAAAARHRIDWQWVKGHAGHAGNERADRLANQAILTLLDGPPPG
jgi:ribonuclease HI